MENKTHSAIGDRDPIRGNPSGCGLENSTGGGVVMLLRFEEDMKLKGAKDIESVVQ